MNTQLRIRQDANDPHPVPGIVFLRPTSLSSVVGGASTRTRSPGRLRKRILPLNPSFPFRVFATIGIITETKHSDARTRRFSLLIILSESAMEKRKGCPIHREHASKGMFTESRLLTRRKLQSTLGEEMIGEQERAESAGITDLARSLLDFQLAQEDASLTSYSTSRGERAPSGWNCAFVLPPARRPTDRPTAQFGCLSACQPACLLACLVRSFVRS